MSSDVGFFLLNKDKRIQGITSSCMKMMNLDLLKLRRLSQNGIGIKKLAPSLLDDSLKEFAFPEKQGGTIDWFLADYEKKNKNKNKLDVSA